MIALHTWNSFNSWSLSRPSLSVSQSWRVEQLVIHVHMCTTMYTCKLTLKTRSNAAAHSGFSCSHLCKEEKGKEEEHGGSWKERY